MPNKKLPAVPNRVPSGDARTQRTQRALGEALVSLMLARDFTDITVQDVLDRAKIGRTTFYAHFRNKEDLLLSDAERFLRLLDAHFTKSALETRRVAPLGELATHVAAYADFAKALKRSGQDQEVWDIIVGELARIIARRFAELRVQVPDAALPIELASRVYAASAITLLEWWLDRDCPISAEELDAKFHTMVWRGVGGGSVPGNAHRMHSTNDP